MLKDLQNSVEEEELVWKAKMAESDEQFRIVRSWSAPLGVSFGGPCYYWYSEFVFFIIIVYILFIKLHFFNPSLYAYLG